MILLDTDVMIDVLRKHSPAAAWLQVSPTEELGLPRLALMELLQGCRTLDEQQRVQALLRPYILYWPTQADCARALADFTAYHLSHNLGVLDSLIAETVIGLGVALATFNEKHYSAQDLRSCMLLPQLYCGS
ncbi:MAG TPA: PIN domain-containing protein [Anaerolineae bacterium]|nr:PIN domain-containing protein [Anaerolineae bacterium]